MSEPARNAARSPGARGRPEEDSRARVRIEPGGFVVTREYDMFVEFCEEVRRRRWLAVCTGDPMVGKTTYAERYTMWDVVSSVYPVYAHSRKPPAEVASCPGVYYKAQVTNTPKQLQTEIEERHRIVSYAIDVAERIRNGQDPHGGLPGLENRAQLVIIDEADRLKANTLEQPRDLYDEGAFELVLMSATPSFAKVLGGNDHFRYRIAHEHEINLLEAAPTREVVANSATVFGLDLPLEAFSDEDATTAMVLISQGRFGTLRLLVEQVERALEANELGCGPGAVTAEVVERAARSMGYSA